MLIREAKMEVSKSEPEDESLCFGPEVLGSNFPSPESPATLLPPFVEGGGRGSLPASRPSSGPAEGDPPPFALPPQLSPGAFRPLNPTSSSTSSSPLSFVVQQPSFREDSDRLTPSSDVSSSSLDRLTPDESSQRTLRKRRVGGGLAHCSLTSSSALPGHCTCPVCGVTVRPHELRSHFHHESKQLEKIPKQVSRHAKDSPATHTHSRNSTSPSSSSGISVPSSSTCSVVPRREMIESRTCPASRTEIFERVRSNRKSRLTARSGRSGAGEEECREAQCPVCHKHLQGTASQLNRHAELCLRRRSSGGAYTCSSEDEEVDVEGENGEEDADGPEEDEYRWAGQTRVRVTSLLRGNFEACGYTTVRPSAEDDEDLNVDGDDTLTYGQAQYTESDVIPCGTDPTSREDEALRRALSTRNEDGANGQNPVSQTDVTKVESEKEEVNSTESDENVIVNGIKTEPMEEQTQVNQASSSKDSSGDIPSLDIVTLQSSSSLQTRPSDQRHLIAALHQQIAELRHNTSRNVQAVLKCLVCMDPYSKPVVSVGCWHVYCEECWLRTLGAKKLCPQCNTITSASDLRKIYI